MFYKIYIYKINCLFAGQQNSAHSFEEITDEELESNTDEDTDDDYFSPDVSEHERDDSSDDFNVLLEQIENELDREPEIGELRKWAVENNINQSSLDKLLTILRARLLPSLPKSSKTFLKTSSARYNIINMEDQNGNMGEFVYFGVAAGLIDLINENIHEGGIELKINADGVPLSKSSNKQFWVIAGQIHYIPNIYDVFPIAIFFGEAKPKNSTIFMEEFIEEITKLQIVGVEIGNRHFDVNLKCFICDTPARSFLKNTLGHKGLHACERCTVVGHTIQKRTVFPSTISEERTDTSFRMMDQPEHHHKETSPILEIRPRINIISSFILDFMHLCCLGIMKKLLEYWLGKHSTARFDVRKRQEISRRMTELHSQIPSEFQRKPRSTQFVAKWKATEFRFFLLYCGPIILKRLLRTDLYNHFLLFHTSCRILCSESLFRRYAHLAKEYLKAFFIALKDYYGAQSQILNAHHLIHLADDVINMGCSLLHLTAFPFESMLGRIKKHLRTPNRQLSQLCRRLFEKKSANIHRKPQFSPIYEILKTVRNDIKQIKFKQFIISTSIPDNTVLLKDGRIISVEKINENPERLVVEGRKLKKLKEVYNYPSDSSVFDTWEVQLGHRRIISCTLNEIDKKMVRLSLSFEENGNPRTYVVPLLH